MKLHISFDIHIKGVVNEVIILHFVSNCRLDTNCVQSILYIDATAYVVS